VNPDASSILFTTLSPFLFLAQQRNNYCFFIIHRRLMNAETRNSGKTAVPAVKPGNGKARRALLCLSVRGYEDVPCGAVYWWQRTFSCLSDACKLVSSASGRADWLPAVHYLLRRAPELTHALLTEGLFSWPAGGGLSERMSEFLLQEFEETARSKV
jgi:hypothetical protein